MTKFYVTRTRYHRVGHIFITFIYSLSAIRDFLLKYLIALTFSGLSENASHICRNPASVSYTSVGSTSWDGQWSRCRERQSIFRLMLSHIRRSRLLQKQRIMMATNCTMPVAAVRSQLSRNQGFFYIIGCTHGRATDYWFLFNQSIWRMLQVRAGSS